MTETPQNRLKRLRIRSWRRGTKEMDLILGGFADAYLDQLDEDLVQKFDSLLEENDQDLYTWVTATVPTPDRHTHIIQAITDSLKNR